MGGVGYHGSPADCGQPHRRRSGLPPRVVLEKVRIRRSPLTPLRSATGPQWPEQPRRVAPPPPQGPSRGREKRRRALLRRITARRRRARSPATSRAIRASSRPATWYWRSGRMAARSTGPTRPRCIAGGRSRLNCKGSASGGSRMRRREFIAGIGSSAAWPAVARAQQPAVSVVGFLSPNPPMMTTSTSPFHFSRASRKPAMSRARTWRSSIGMRRTN